MKDVVRESVPPRRGQWLLWTLALIILAFVMTAGWLGYRATAALSKISDPPADRQRSGLLSILGDNRQNHLAGEDDNRINILLLGIGGANHPGGLLTDTIILMSIQPKDGKVALLSIPRDLYVPIPGAGSGKINSADAVGEQKEAGAGPALTKETVSAILGMPIHYYVRADFQGFEKLIDALGGVDITVEKPIADPLYPDDQTIGYAPFYLKAGLQHMTGKIALKFARSRETTSDFDRSHRQQQLLAAMKDQMLSLGTLTNPKKLADLIEIAGDHVRTDLAVWEMERLVGFAKNINPNDIHMEVLDTSLDGPLTSRIDPRLGYIIVPRRGTFTDIQTIASNLFAEHPNALLQPATISIQNGSGDPTVGGNIALLLRSYGYQVIDVTELKKPRTTTQILKKTATSSPDIEEFLRRHFSVTPAIGPAGTMTTDFVLMLGSDYHATSG